MLFPFSGGKTSKEKRVLSGWMYSVNFISKIALLIFLFQFLFAL
jgi:hypothetical protein